MAGNDRTGPLNAILSAAGGSGDVADTGSGAGAGGLGGGAEIADIAGLDALSSAVGRDQSSAAAGRGPTPTAGGPGEAIDSAPAADVLAESALTTPAEGMGHDGVGTDPLEAFGGAGPEAPAKTPEEKLAELVGPDPFAILYNGPTGFYGLDSGLETIEGLKEEFTTVARNLAHYYVKTDGMRGAPAANLAIKRLLPHYPELEGVVKVPPLPVEQPRPSFRQAEDQSLRALDKLEDEPKPSKFERGFAEQRRAQRASDVDRAAIADRKATDDAERDADSSAGTEKATDLTNKGELELAVERVLTPRPPSEFFDTSTDVAAERRRKRNQEQKEIREIEKRTGGDPERMRAALDQKKRFDQETDETQRKNLNEFAAELFDVRDLDSKSVQFFRRRVTAAAKAGVISHEAAQGLKTITSEITGRKNEVVPDLALFYTNRQIAKDIERRRGIVDKSEGANFAGGAASLASETAAKALNVGSIIFSTMSKADRLHVRTLFRELKRRSDAGDKEANLIINMLSANGS